VFSWGKRENQKPQSENDRVSIYASRTSSKFKEHDVACVRKQAEGLTRQIQNYKLIKRRKIKQLKM
jgi:hypothetical protein